jgi:hypothetical protein
MSHQRGVPLNLSAASPGGSSPGGSSPGGSSPGGSSGTGSLFSSVQLAASVTDLVASLSQVGSALQIELTDLERSLAHGGIPSVSRLQQTAKGLAFLGLAGGRGTSASPGGSSPGGSSPGGSSPGGSSPGGSSPGGSSGLPAGLAALTTLSDGLLDAGREIQRDVTALRGELEKRGLATNAALERIQQLGFAMAIVDPQRIGRLGGIGVVGQAPGGSSPGGSSPGGSSPGGSSPGGSSPGGSSGAAFGLGRLIEATTQLSQIARVGGLVGQGQSPGGSSPGGSSPGGSSPGGSSPGGSSPGGSSGSFTTRFGEPSLVASRLFESLINVAGAFQGVGGRANLSELSVTSPREARRGKSMSPKTPPRGRE